MKTALARTPPVVRLFVKANRALYASVYLHEMFWNEMLWAWTSPAERERVNLIMYGDATSYMPGGTTFERGLHEWEQAAISAPPFPQSGRILLGGAGAGRELNQLCRMGYEVIAFEPCEPLFHGLRQVAGEYPSSVAVHASYQDLISAALRQSGPLAPHVAGGAFDAVICGWESFSYLIAESERRGLFQAIRTVAPCAPVLLSFLQTAPETSRLERLRAPLRGLLRAMGAKSLAGPGDACLAHAGFFHKLTVGELQDLAYTSGYRLAYHRPEPYGHAMLTPA